MELSERIAQVRKQAGLSQEQLGEKLGVSRQAVSKWESGQTNPDISYITAMCQLFNVSSDWLLFGEYCDPAVTPTHCPGCQAIVTERDKFCPNCGRNLKEPAELTYTLLLQNGESIARAKAVRDKLSKMALFPADAPIMQGMQAVDHIPCILARGLTVQQVQVIQETIRDIDPYSCSCFQFYQDDSGSTPEELAEKQPFPFALKKPREPLSFGMILLAVVLGIIIVSFL